MEFRKIVDQPEHFISHRFAIKLPDSRYFEVFVLNNLYGYNVAGMYSGEKIYNFNYSCGPERWITLLTHSIVMTLISRGMPIQEFIFAPEINPWFKDEFFFSWLQTQNIKYLTR